MVICKCGRAVQSIAARSATVRLYSQWPASSRRESLSPHTTLRTTRTHAPQVQCQLYIHYLMCNANIYTMYPGTTFGENLPGSDIIFISFFIVKCVVFVPRYLVEILNYSVYLGICECCGYKQNNVRSLRLITY